MSLKKSIGNLIRTIGRLPVVRTVIVHPSVRGTIENWPGMRTLYGGGWDLVHPFDRLHGTSTSGFTPGEELPSSPLEPAQNNGYAGSQPSIIRTALETLPSLESFTFVDLGCGKGRILFVASEFPFHDIVGVELSPSLTEEGRRNAAIIKERFPERVVVRIEEGDATAFALPKGNVVIFLYNPFGADAMAKVLAGIEAALAEGNRSIYVVSYNPVTGACVDASPALHRHFAAMVPYAPEERGYGPDGADAVVVWRGGVGATSTAGANARIVLTNGGKRAVLAA